LLFTFSFNLAFGQTLAHWDFEFDSDQQVFDQGPYGVHGVPFHSPLSLTGKEPLNKSRSFLDRNSLISFGPTKASPLDFNLISDLDISLSLQISKFNSFSRIFDNGQLSFGLIDNHFYLFLKTFYGSAGFISSAEINLNTSYNLNLSFDSGFLCLYEHSNRLGCTYTGLSYIDAQPAGSSILVGESFLGSIDEMKISSFSRFDSTPPFVSIISPSMDDSHSTLNELNVFLSDNLSGVDPSSIHVFFNGDELSDLQITPQSIHGTLPIDSMLEVNELVIEASDLSGNQRTIELLLEPKKLLDISNEGLDVEAKLLSLSKKQACLVTNFNDVRCFDPNNTNKLSIVYVGQGQPLRDVSSLQVGESVACALDLVGDVYCWRDSDRFKAERMMGLPAKSVMLSVGKDHGCTLLENSEVWCFDQGLAPFMLNNKGHLIDFNMAKFSNSICSTYSDGFIRCYNLSGNIANEILNFQFSMPKKVAETNSLQCILDENSLVNCFSRIDGKSFQLFQNLTIVELKANQHLLCALDSERNLYCYNDTKKDLARINFSSSIHFFDLGQDFSCAILTSGETECFGSRTRLPKVL
jgi:hypothetical protein